jgi:signal transduction histidine kinase/ActR/RegA family two-component response regulator
VNILTSRGAGDGLSEGAPAASARSSPASDHDARLAGSLQRLRWAGAAMPLIVLACLLGEPQARRDAVMLTGNLILLLGGPAVAVATRRGRWTIGRAHAAGALLLATLSALALFAFAHAPAARFAVMVALQLVAAAALFLSTRWLVGYVIAATTGSLIVMLTAGHGDLAAVVATSAVLSVVAHLGFREHGRLRERAHARALADALALAHRQLEEKERAERARTEIERSREALASQLAEARTMEAIATLAGGLAHDLNNSLTVVINLADCMMQEAQDDTAREDAEHILLAARRSADLIRNLLAVGRRGPFNPVPTRPESIVTRLATVLARTLPKAVRVETSFAPDLAELDADQAALTDALMNLCLNGSHAMGGSGVLSLGARVEEHEPARARVLGVEPGRYVVLSVRDTGHGMDVATRARIFEPFFTTKGPGRGTGLGLTMVQTTMQRHRGAVTCESAVGRGTVFELHLPARAANQEQPAQPARTVSSSIAMKPGARILVVDDDDLVRTVTVRTLERAGFDVVTAVNGKAALDRLAADGSPDLMLLDMAMPVMAGPETFRRARAFDPELRILLASGFTAPEEARTLLDEGALGLVEKPFAASDLLAAVERACRRRRAQA